MASGEDLGATEERFRLVAEATSDVIWDWNLETNGVWLSPNVSALFGHRPEAVGKTAAWWEAQIHPDERERVMSGIRGTIAIGTLWRDEYRFRRGDGSYAVVVDRGRVVRDADGRAVRMVGAMVDVSERRRQERERLRLAQQHRDLARAAWMVNSARSLDEILSGITHTARQVIGAHQAVTSLTIGASLAQAIHTVSLSDKYAAWRGYEEKPSGAGIYRLVCEQNRTIRLTQEELERHPAWLGFGAARDRHPPMRGWLATALVDRNGRNMGLIQLSDKLEDDFAAADEAVLEQLAQLASVAIENAQLIEAARRHTEQLEERVEDRTRKLREANRQLELFTSTVSHDLRAPVRHVLGFVEALEEAEGGRLGDESAGYLRRIGDAARRMRRLIDDLLVLSRTSRTTLVRRDVDLDALVRRLRAELTLLAGDRRIEWQIDRLPAVHGDPGLVEVAFTNLLANALKYSMQRPTAHIAVRAHPPAGGQVVVSVADDGVGFDARFAHNLFGLFQRLHPEEEFEGTGIGLATVREIVERHGGGVWAESEPGEGATFYVALPEARDAAA